MSRKSRQLDWGAGGRTEGLPFSRRNPAAGRSWRWRVAVILTLSLGVMGITVSAPAEVVQVTLSAKVTTVQVAKDDEREAWTFNGTMPGPVIRVKEGDTVQFTLKNEADRVHSIDFHAAKTPWDLHFQGIGTGTEGSFTWEADYPGVFYYHCGTDPMIQHIANGMYGVVIVEPRQTFVVPDREYVLVQSEIYPSPFEVDAMMAGKPKFVVFNGRANRYMDEPLQAKPGELIRLHVVNAGPNHFSAFHVIGALFDRVYASGNPKNVEYGVQTYTLPPGGAATFELRIPLPGLYPMVTHALQDALIGAVGMIKVSSGDEPHSHLEQETLPSDAAPTMSSRVSE